MEFSTAKRKLAAILSADVQGYSRLMGEDEEATIRMLTLYREVMSTLIQQHRGRGCVSDEGSALPCCRDQGVGRPMQAAQFWTEGCQYC